MFELGIVAKEIFLSYSTQFVFSTIRLVPRNVVMVVIDVCGKASITGEWIYGITWKYVYFNIFVLFVLDTTTSILKLMFPTIVFPTISVLMVILVAVLLPLLLLLLLLLFLFIYLFIFFYSFIYLFILFTYLFIYYFFYRFDCYSHFCCCCCHHYCCFCCWGHRWLFCVLGYCCC